jgi:uncharacterized protein
MKIILAGGSGHLGKLLVSAWHGRHEVVVLSRNPKCAFPSRLWDGRTLGPWAEEIDGADAVINLAGRHVDARYDDKTKDDIFRSRVDSARVIGQAINQAKQPPRVWLQMSTATIYAHRFDAPNDERKGILGGTEPEAPEEWRFSVDVAKAWEREVDLAVIPGVRKVKLRTAMVMRPEKGGAFHALLRHVRLGFGRFGDGRQYMSWIHERDFVRAIEWIITHDDLERAVNLAAPNPIPNAEFMRILAEKWGALLQIPVSGWVLRFGAWLARTEPELVLKSRRVVPLRLQESGFEFRFPTWSEAAQDLCERWKNESEETWTNEPSRVW